MAVRNTGHRALPIGHTQRTPGVKPGQNKWPAGRLRDHAGYRSRLSRRRERVDRPVSPFPRFPNAEIARLYDPSRQRMPLDAVPAPLEDRARLEPRPLISLHLRNGYKSEDWVGFGKTVRTLNAWMLKQHALDSLWVHKPAAAPKNPIRSTQEANRVGPIERDEVVCLEEAFRIQSTISTGLGDVPQEHRRTSQGESSRRRSQLLGFGHRINPPLDMGIEFSDTTIESPAGLEIQVREARPRLRHPVEKQVPSLWKRLAKKRAEFLAERFTPGRYKTHARERLPIPVGHEKSEQRGRPLDHVHLPGT